jgi:hypothetical protein
MGVPSKRGAAAAALMARRAAGPEMPPPFSRSSCRAGDGVGDGVGDGAGGLEVDEVVDAVAAAGSVSLGCPVEGGAHVPVLDGQGDQPVGPAGNVPGEAAPEAAEADVPVRVGGDVLAGQSVAGCLAVGPGHEVLDPVPERGRLQGAGPGPAGRQVVGVVIEQQVPCGDHVLEDADGVDDGGDGDLGGLALGAAGLVVAVLVDSGLVLVAADQVPSGLPGWAGDGIRAASGAQAQDFPGRMPVR